MLCLEYIACCTYMFLTCFQDKARIPNTSALPGTGMGRAAGRGVAVQPQISAPPGNIYYLLPKHAVCCSKISDECFQVWTKISTVS